MPKFAGDWIQVVFAAAEAKAIDRIFVSAELFIIFFSQKHADKLEEKEAQLRSTTRHFSLVLFAVYFNTEHNTVTSFFVFCHF